VFDPFKDFDTAGYLRNFAAEKDLDIVKAAEHQLFRANLPEVVHHLAALTDITYADFCRVHKTLFQGLYPWAGQDRSLTAPDSAVHKGETLFAHPADVRRAVEHALRLGRNATTLREFWTATCAPLSDHPSQSRPGPIPWRHSLAWMGRDSSMKSVAASAIPR